MERIMNQEDITRKVHQLGLQDESVVTGQGTLVALGIEEQGMFGHMELTVDAPTYRALRETSSWRDADEGLRHGSVEVRLGSPDTMARRGFQLDGIQYEGLPDIYGLAQAAGDSDTETLIRDALLDPGTLLPSAVLAGKLDALHAKLPERLHDTPELLVAAQGLYTVRTLFGSLADPNSINTYQGDYETLPVASTYHNYEHTWYDVVGGVIEHAAVSNTMDDDELLSAVAAAADHDTVMGHGRQADNPTGYDELCSAELSRDRLLRAGASERNARASYEGILATGFNEATSSQNIRPEVGFLPVQIALAGADMSRQSKPYGIHNGFLWPLEEFQRRNGGQHLNTIRAEMQTNYGTAAPETLLDAIDDVSELRQRLGWAIAGNGTFFEGLRPPEGWSLDSPAQRQASAIRLRAIGARIEAGSSVLAEYQRLQRDIPAPWTHDNY